MKKLSIILLVLALVGGMAFGADAAITGSATFSTSFDLQTKSGGSDGDTGNVNLDYDASMVLLTGGSAAKTGEGDVYAVLEVSVADISITVDETSGAWTGFTPSAIAVDTFKIVAGDVTINLLGNSPVGNFVQYFDYTVAGTPDIDVASLGLATTNGGVDVTAGDLTVGGDIWINTNAFMLWSAYSTDLAEGLTVSLAAGFDNTAGTDVEAQLAYAADAYSVTVGIDTADNFTLYEAEADINAVVDIVTIDANVYYDSTTATVRVANQNTIDLESLPVGLDFYYKDIKHGEYISADIATDIDNMSITLRGGFEYTLMSADVAATLEYVVSDETKIEARAGYDMATSFNVGATLTQTIEAGSIVAMVDYNNDATIDASINFSSTSLVDGATVALGWAAADVAADLGDITASVTVSL